MLHGYSFIVTDNIYKDIAEDVETKFDSSNYELDKQQCKVDSSWTESKFTRCVNNKKTFWIFFFFCII